MQTIPLGVMLGGFFSLLVAVAHHGDMMWPIAVLVLGLVLTIPSSIVVMVTTGAEERKLQSRLDACAADAMLAFAPPPGRAGWTIAPAVLVRAMPQRRSAPYRTALYAANTAARGVLPVAVRLAATAPPAVGSGAWLRLHPTDPAVAWIDPDAAPSQHPHAANDPALANLSRTERGLAVPARDWLWPLLAGAAVMLLVITVAFATA